MPLDRDALEGALINMFMTPGESNYLLLNKFLDAHMPDLKTDDLKVISGTDPATLLLGDRRIPVGKKRQYQADKYEGEKIPAKKVRFSTEIEEP